MPGRTARRMKEMELKSVAPKILSLVVVGVLALGIQTSLAHEVDPAEDQSDTMVEDSANLDDSRGSSEVELRIEDDESRLRFETRLEDGSRIEFETRLEDDLSRTEFESEVREREAEIHGQPADLATGMDVPPGMELEIEHGVAVLKPHGGDDEDGHRQRGRDHDNSGPSASSGPGPNGSSAEDRSGSNHGSSDDRRESRGSDDSGRGRR